VNSTFAGVYASVFRGQGLDFEEVAEYREGDDIRNMDWKVTARTNEPHLKLYREERERSVLLCVDQGPRMQFGTRGAFKAIQAARAAALIGWAANRLNDRVGGILYGGQTQHFRPTKDRRALWKLLKAMTDEATIPPEDPNALRPRCGVRTAERRRAVSCSWSATLTSTRSRSSVRSAADAAAQGGPGADRRPRRARPARDRPRAVPRPWRRLREVDTDDAAGREAYAKGWRARRAPSRRCVSASVSPWQPCAPIATCARPSPRRCAAGFPARPDPRPDCCSRRCIPVSPTRSVTSTASTRSGFGHSRPAGGCLSPAHSCGLGAVLALRFVWRYPFFTWHHSTRRQLLRLRQRSAAEPVGIVAAELSELLRRIAIARCGREACAGLAGTAWLDWLSANDPARLRLGQGRQAAGSPCPMPARHCGDADTLRALIDAAVPGRGAESRLPGGCAACGRGRPVFDFAWPWLALLLPLPVLVWRLSRPGAATEPRERRITLLQPALRELDAAFATRRPAACAARGCGPWLLALAWVALVLALMRPQWLEQHTETRTLRYDLMLAVDASHSMEALDFTSEGQQVTRMSVVKGVMAGSSASGRAIESG